MQVIELANKIRAALSTLDPEHQATYQQNYLTFSAELRALDREIAQLLSHSTAVAFMVQHPVWGNFADRYGVRQIAIEEEGKSPRAKKLVQIIQLAKQSRIKVIFVQPQFSQRAAEQIAREIGARITTVDPLAADYLPNLRHFAQQLSRSD